jgi:hypothetical protein
MGASSIIVRPLASPAEHQLHFQFADQAFSPDPSPWDPSTKKSLFPPAETADPPL